MLRIVPADVESGDEWGSDTEADARDYGRFRRIAGADPATIQNALKLYPPRNPDTRARIYHGLGLEPPEEDNRGRSGGGRGGSSRSAGDGGGSRGGKARGGGGRGAGREGGHGGSARMGGGLSPNVVSASTITALPTYNTNGTQPPRFGKHDKALLATHGAKQPKGKHPGYIITLYGKKVRRCGSCPRCLAPDCGQCRYCEDMPKHGGRGSYKQPCEARKCDWVEFDRKAKTVITQLSSEQQQRENGSGNNDGDGTSGTSVRGAGSPRGRGRGGSAAAASGGRGGGAAFTGFSGPTADGSSGGGGGGKGKRSGRGGGSTPRAATSRKSSSGFSRSRKCGDCHGCRSVECGQCKFCSDMPKNGGPGKIRQVCIQKRCHALGRTPGRVRSPRSEFEEEDDDEDDDETMSMAAAEEDSGSDGSDLRMFRCALVCRVLKEMAQGTAVSSPST